MKYLIILLTIFAVSAQAEEVPKYMRDAVITVTLKDGKTYTFSGNEYKVVKRGAKKVAAPVAVASPSPEKSEPKKSEERSYKNRVTLIVGHGLTGKMKDSHTPSTVDVEQDRDVIGGLVLQHDLKNDYHLMGGGMTNRTFFLGIGKGF